MKSTQSHDLEMLLLSIRAVAEKSGVDLRKGRSCPIVIACTESDNVHSRDPTGQDGACKGTGHMTIRFDMLVGLTNDLRALVESRSGVCSLLEWSTFH